MNEKQAKKIRQYYARDFRVGVFNKLTAGVLNELIRKKPKRVPLFIWKFFAKIYINPKYYDKVFVAKKDEK